MIKQHNLLTAMICLFGLPLANTSMADEERGENARSCIQTRTLKSTAVVDDRNVLFVKKGNSVYHNRLPEECKGLSETRMFSYTSNSGNLCKLDIIAVVDRQGRETRACRLGYFYTITTEELRTLVENSQKPPEDEKLAAPDALEEDSDPN